MEKTKAANQRKNYFIEKRFQTNFIFKFCLLLILAGLLTGATLYLLAMESTSVTFVNSRVMVKTTADFLLPILIQTFLVVTIMISIATIFLLLFVSHKIAGPLFHFKKAMQELGSGNFALAFRVRKLDQLQELSDSFENMIKTTRQELAQVKGSFRSLKEKLDTLSENEVTDHKRSTLKELKKISEEINQKMDYFKT